MTILTQLSATLTIDQVGSFASIVSLLVAASTFCVAFYTARVVRRINSAYRKRIFVPKFTTVLSKQIGVLSSHVGQKRWDDALAQAERAETTLEYLYDHGDEKVRKAIEKFHDVMNKSERVPSRKAIAVLSSLERVQLLTKRYAETIQWPETT